MILLPVLTLIQDSINKACMCNLKKKKKPQGIYRKTKERTYNLV